MQAGRTPVVLTKYVDHAKKLSERLKTYADRLILLTGANGTKTRRAQVEELNKVNDSDSLILVGMGSLLGEASTFRDLIPCSWRLLFQGKCCGAVCRTT